MVQPDAVLSTQPGEELVSNQEIRIVHESYSRCLLDQSFFDNFYDRFRKSNPQIDSMFTNVATKRQHELMRHGIMSLMLLVEGNDMGAQAISRVRDSHSRHGMGIDPSLYALWLECMIETIRESDSDISPSIENAWRNVLSVGTEFIASGY